MTATPLTPTNRYFPVGTRRYYTVPTIADISAPTRAELDAGTDLTAEVVDGSVSGFELNADTVDVPDAGSKFTSKIDGRTSADTCSIGIYLSEDTDDARSLFAKGTNQYVVIFPEGDHDPITTPAHSYTCDVWPVRVLSAPISQDMSNGGQMKVNWAPTREPALNVPVPASV